MGTTNFDFTKNIRTAANGHITKMAIKKRQDHITEATLQLIEQRREFIQQRRFEDAADKSKEIKKARRKDRRDAILKALDKELDLRDKFLGIRQLKNGFKPAPYAIKDKKNGRGALTSSLIIMQLAGEAQFVYLYSNRASQGRRRLSGGINDKKGKRNLLVCALIVFPRGMQWLPRNK